MGDGLSAMHFRVVWAEIQGRFFSQEEADRLKAVIDRHTVTDPTIRAAGAKAWEEPRVESDRRLPQLTPQGKKIHPQNTK